MTPNRGTRRAGLIAIGLVAAVGAVAVAGIQLGAQPARTSPPSSVQPTVDTTQASPAAPSPEPTFPTTSPEPTTPATRVAVVPVVGYRSTVWATDPDDLTAVFAGAKSRFNRIEVVDADAAAILGRLGYTLEGAAMPHLVVAPDPASLIADLIKHPERLGFLRADDVTPAVRAVPWAGVSLFGVDRVRALADWPLSIELASGAPASAHPYDPATGWTLVAGGDVNLDGAVAHAVKQEGRGVDYPWDGGHATITSRYCCTAYGFVMARAHRDGDSGAVRALLEGADLAIANFENPAPDDFTYHPAGFDFSADPALIEGLVNAGIDWVSLANNHIGNSGPKGILETLANLDKWGIAHGGAGADLAEARKPSLLAAGGITIAILGYDTIKPAYGATSSSPGSNQMSAARVRIDIARARAAGADLVIVFPHWGTEYSSKPTKRQRALAHAAIDAGADLVLGNHTHWVGAMEVYKGRPIVYSLADFVFSISRAEQTREGILVEATYTGNRLVQLWIHPFFIVNGVQPNLLDPAAPDDVVMHQLFDASGTLLPW